MGHYLHRLPIRPAESEPRARSKAGPPLRLRAVVAALALFAISSLAAMALGRMSATLQGDVPPGWPASGCLSASVAPWRGALSGQVIVGQASLCIADSGLRGMLDLEHLEPMALYVEWIAYFENPSLCSFGPLLYQVQHFNRPCTLADLGGPAPHGMVPSAADAAADAQGFLHVDGRAREISLAPQAQAWLLVSRPSWSPIAQQTDRVGQDDTSEPIARAVFDLP
jgi:hypothetical protein